MNATNIYIDKQHPNYIAKMEDGKYRFVTPGLTNVFAEFSKSVFETRLKSKAWDGTPTAQEIIGSEGTILLNTLNESLATLNKAAVALGRMKKGVKEKPSIAKANSSRENGKKGGRPRKDRAETSEL